MSPVPVVSLVPVVSPVPCGVPSAAAERGARLGLRLAVRCNAALRDPPYTHHLNYLISPNCCTFINH